LTIAVVTIVGVALVALSATVYVLFGEASRSRFDERLADTARAVGLMAAAGEARPSERAAELATLDQSRGSTSYQVWQEDGSVLARYPPLASPMPRPPDGAAPRFENVRLPDGGSGRLYRAWLEPAPAGSSASTVKRVAVAVLRDTEHLERKLLRLRTTLWVSTLGVVLLAALVVSLVIRRSLRGVARLSASISSIDASSLGERLELRGLPDELRPPFAKVNELLSRIEHAVNRERQFSADVSHELRTPLAGLRTILEVSSSRERAAFEHRTALKESLEVVGQLEAIVENLLALARLGAGQMSDGHQEEVCLADLVEACFAPLGDTARRRHLRFENRIAPQVSLVSDKLKLRLIAANLLSNAVQYTAEGGRISVESDPSLGVVLRVRDSGPAIPNDAIAKLFDPFFRLDHSRSGAGEHCGIGLTLVRGLCDTLRYEASVENEPGGAVAFSITAAPEAGLTSKRGRVSAPASGA
jgi:signal transduction histidine kinase